MAGPGRSTDGWHSMLQNHWSYALALYRENGTPIGRLPVDVDWEPARQWARHVALCKGASLRERGDDEVRPLWRRADGPALGGFQVAVETDGQPERITCDFPSAYFSGAARALSAPLVEAGHLSAGEVFRYIPLAYPRLQPAPGGASFIVQEVASAPRLREASLDDLTRQSAVIGKPAPDEVPVFAPGLVLDEIAALTKQASPLETGGALVGHLHRDAGAGAVFARILAQLPARHTQASEVRLAFTSDTWHDLRRELDARGEGELMLGWWHSHPVREWYRGEECPEREHEPCALGADCFSEHDRAVHRTVFPGAHAVALVANDVSVADVRFAVYGWSRGMLVPRGLHVDGQRQP